MSVDNLQALKELAEAAPPGPWINENDSLYFKDDGYTRHLLDADSGSDVEEGSYYAALKFIAAANPAAVSEMIKEVERGQRMLVAACQDLGAIGEALGADMDDDGDALLGMVNDLKQNYLAARDRKNSITALKAENKALQEDLVTFKGGISALGEACKKLTFCARTSGGIAGPDTGLMEACDSAEKALSLVGVSRAIDYIEGLKSENEALRKDAERYRWTSIEGNWVARMFGKWRAHVGEYGDASPTDWYATREEAIDAAMAHEATQPLNPA
jgi:hypothetical protein